MDKFVIKYTDIKDLKSLKNIKESNIVISNCHELTSLEGIPNTISYIKIVNCTKLPKLLKDFAVNINIHGFNDYYIDLLIFTIKSKRENELKTLNLPSNIINDIDSIRNSINGICKFKL